VYFRVSEDEFRQFVNVCEQAGARSVSDLARNAVQKLIAEGQRQRDGHELDEKMQRLERLIAAVTEQLQLLSSQTKEGPLMGLPGSAERLFWETTAEQNGFGEK
jgi:hypothetical protein